MKHGFDADTAEELVAAWDREELIRTIEMGGMGPGYEQALQVCFIELLRAKSPERWDETVSRISPDLCGLSGAQVGAAKALASQVLEKGMKACLEEVKKADPTDDRCLLISRAWPKAPRPYLYEATMVKCPRCTRIGPFIHDPGPIGDCAQCSLGEQQNVQLVPT